MRCTKKVGHKRKSNDKKQQFTGPSAGSAVRHGQIGSETCLERPYPRRKPQDIKLCVEVVPSNPSQGRVIRVPSESSGSALLPHNDNARYQRIAIFAGELLPSRLPPSDLAHVGICVLLRPDGQEGVGADRPAASKTGARDDRYRKKASCARRGPGDGAGGRPRGERVPALRERVLKKKMELEGRPVSLPDIRNGLRQ